MIFQQVMGSVCTSKLRIWQWLPHFIEFDLAISVTGVWRSRSEVLRIIMSSRRDFDGEVILMFIKDNLSMWVLDIRARLRKKKLWKYTQNAFKPSIVLKNKKRYTDEQKAQIKIEKTKWEEKIMKAIDEMTSRISLKVKQMFEVSHFNNDYLMLRKLYELLQFVKDAQFMRLMKKFYSLKIDDFNNMTEFLIHVKIFMKKITAIEVNFITNKQILICMMITLNSRYENLIQIWSLLPDLTSKRVRNMLLKKKRRQQNREIFDDYRVTTSKQSKKKKCSHCDRNIHSENKCWKLHSELASDWFKKKEKKNNKNKSKSKNETSKINYANYSIAFWVDLSRECMRFETSWRSKSKEYKSVLNALYENVIISRSDDLYGNMSTHWKPEWLEYRRYENEHPADSKNWIYCRVWRWTLWRFWMIVAAYGGEHSENLVWSLPRMGVNTLQAWRTRSECRIGGGWTPHENRTKMEAEVSGRWKDDPKRYVACKKCRIERIEGRWAVGSAYESVLKIR